MGTVFRVLFFSGLALALVWGLIVLQAQEGRFDGIEDRVQFAAAFPGRQVAPGVEFRHGVSFASDVFRLGELGGQALLQVLARRAEVVVGLLPLIGVSFLAAFLGGSLFRERLRSGTAHASPALSFLSRRMIEGVTAFLLVWTFSPLPLGYGTIYPALLVGVLGVVVYMGNVPLRI